jgi:hypothetical protein
MCAAEHKYFAFSGKLLQDASVAISAQMDMSQEDIHENRVFGFKLWDDAIMTEVDRLNTHGSAHTIVVEVWQVVFGPHLNCPPQCMGAQGLKCVVVPADRARWLASASVVNGGRRVWNNADYLNKIRLYFDCERISWRPAILEMHDGEFMVCTTPTGLQHSFRLNPFMTGRNFFDMMVLHFGISERDWELKMGEELVMLDLSLLMSGIHLGFNAVDTPLSLKRPVAD